MSQSLLYLKHCAGRLYTFLPSPATKFVEARTAVFDRFRVLHIIGIIGIILYHSIRFYQISIDIIWYDIIYMYIYVIYSIIYVYIFYTSSTAQGGGGSFKNRKPIGEVGCCESRMAERSHWGLLSFSLSLAFSDYLPTSTYLPTYLSIYVSIYPSIHLSIYPSIHLSIYLSIYLCICQSIYRSTYLSLSLSLI